MPIWLLQALFALFAWSIQRLLSKVALKRLGTRKFYLSTEGHERKRRDTGGHGLRPVRDRAAPGSKSRANKRTAEDRAQLYRVNEPAESSVGCAHERNDNIDPDKLNPIKGWV